jgi:hypothetical protein
MNEKLMSVRLEEKCTQLGNNDQRNKHELAELRGGVE